MTKSFDLEKASNCSLTPKNGERGVENTHVFGIKCRAHYIDTGSDSRGHGLSHRRTREGAFKEAVGSECGVPIGEFLGMTSERGGIPRQHGPGTRRNPYRSAA